MLDNLLGKPSRKNQFRNNRLLHLSICISCTVVISHAAVKCKFNLAILFSFFINIFLKYLGKNSLLFKPGLFSIYCKNYA